MTVKGGVVGEGKVLEKWNEDMKKRNIKYKVTKERKEMGDEIGDKKGKKEKGRKEKRNEKFTSTIKKDREDGSYVLGQQREGRR